MVKKQNRHRVILREVSLHNRVLLQDIARMLQVSNDTIRRDIKELDKQEKLKKVHGGAISMGYQYHHHEANTQIYGLEQKIKIARKAQALIVPDSVVMVSGGTTNLELVRHLPKNLTGTFFTPSLSVALELMAHPSLDVIFIGGRLSKDAQIAACGQALEQIKDISVDLCFLGTGYLDAKNGLSEFDWDIVQIKKAMLQSADQVISLTISEKLNTTQRYKISNVEAIHTLITELEPEDEQLQAYHKAGILIL